MAIRGHYFLQLQIGLRHIKFSLKSRDTDRSKQTVIVASIRSLLIKYLVSLIYSPSQFRSNLLHSTHAAESTELTRCLFLLSSLILAQFAATQTHTHTKISN